MESFKKIHNNTMKSASRKIPSVRRVAFASGSAWMRPVRSVPQGPVLFFNTTQRCVHIPFTVSQKNVHRILERAMTDAAAASLHSDWEIWLTDWLTTGLLPGDRWRHSKREVTVPSTGARRRQRARAHARRRRAPVWPRVRCAQEWSERDLERRLTLNYLYFWTDNHFNHLKTLILTLFAPFMNQFYYWGTFKVSFTTFLE